jgi:hypothetical protein
MSWLIRIAEVVGVALACWGVIRFCQDRLATIGASAGGLVTVAGLFTSSLSVLIIGAVIVIATPIGLAHDPRLGPQRRHSYW